MCAWRVAYRMDIDLVLRFQKYLRNELLNLYFVKHSICNAAFVDDAECTDKI